MSLSNKLPLVTLFTAASCANLEESRELPKPDVSVEISVPAAQSFLYLDEDMDGHGGPEHLFLKQGEAVPSCANGKGLMVAPRKFYGDQAKLACLYPPEEGSSQPEGYLPAVSTEDDCDDSDDSIFLGAPERANQTDDNCNDGVDEHLNLAPIGVPLVTMIDDRREESRSVEIPWETMLGDSLKWVADKDESPTTPGEDMHLLSRSWLFTGKHDLAEVPQKISGNAAVELLYAWGLPHVRDYVAGLNERENASFSADLASAVAYASSFDYQKETAYLKEMRATTCQPDPEYGRLTAFTARDEDPSCEILFVRYGSKDLAHEAIRVETQFRRGEQALRATYATYPVLSSDKVEGFSDAYRALDVKYPLPKFDMDRKMHASMYRRVDQGTITADELRFWTHRLSEDLADLLASECTE